MKLSSVCIVISQQKCPSEYPQQRISKKIAWFEKALFIYGGNASDVFWCVLNIIFIWK